MFYNVTNKFWSLFMIGLADADGFKIYIQVCMWLDFPPLIVEKENLTTPDFLSLRLRRLG